MEPDLLIKNSQNLCDTANKILKQTKTEEIFSQLGQVEIIGSLKLGLMYRRDIDLLVISDKVEKIKALEITKEFLDSGKFRTVALADYQTYPGFDMPLGFYWELVVIEDDQEWKFDVWYLGSGEKYTKLVLDSIKKFEQLLSENPQKAEIILKIKEAYFDGVKYKDNIKSFDIYKAVLENGVMSVEEFKAIK